jgi:hypothetical protein
MSNKREARASEKKSLADGYNEIKQKKGILSAKKIGLGLQCEEIEHVGPLECDGE